MPPTTSRDFQKAAAQRLATAEALRVLKLNLDAQYLGGYTVECSLKAMILDRTPVAGRPAKLLRISTGAAMHRPDVLLAELRELGVLLPPRDYQADEAVQLDDGFTLRVRLA